MTNPYMTLAVVFDKDRERVLLCFHEKQKMFNYIGGKSIEGETYEDTTYRELYEETGIAFDDIDLVFVRREDVVRNIYSRSERWIIHIMTGVLKHDVNLVATENPILWMPLTKIEAFQYDTFGYGNCWCFLLESMVKLGMDISAMRRVKNNE